ncbi:hypothetical protein HanIR_Chr13g0658641 [Helianthus annuus]|nr:hypothetical protein HanIR_Chr13g0658641 [Helianthus annuus]
MLSGHIKRSNLSHSYTSNLLNFTRTLLATASDSHKYLISLHILIFNSSTAPRYFITPLQTTSLSPVIDSIFNLVTAEAISISLLNRPLSHLVIFRTFTEGSVSSVTSTKLGQSHIFRTFNDGNTTPLLVDHFFHSCICLKLRISSEGNARLVPRNSKPTASTSSKPSINNSLSKGSCPSGGREVHLLQSRSDTCFK